MSWIFNNKEKVFGTLIGVILLVVLMTQLSLEDFKETFFKISWEYLLIIFFLTVAVYIFRSYRFYLLLQKKISIKDLFFISCAHNLANNVLPARSGEVSYIYLANKRCDLGLPYITTSLLVVRYMDLVATVSLFPILLFFLKDIPESLQTVRWIAIAFVVVLFLIMFLVYIFHEKILERLSSKTHEKKWKRKLAGFIANGLEVIQFLKKNIPMVITLAVATLLIWGVAFSSTFVLTTAMDLPLPFVGVAVGTTFVVLTSILPINSFLGIGIYEGSWTLAMVMLGIDKDLAIATGVSMHIIRIITYILFGLLGLNLFLGASSRNTKRTENSREV